VRLLLNLIELIKYREKISVAAQNDIKNWACLPATMVAKIASIVVNCRQP
jgi:hypothetical protein